MAKRYIDADELIDHLQYNLGLLGKPDVEKEPIAHGCYIVLEDMLVRILTTHTADVVEVRRGKWTENKTEYFLYGCSLCGYRVDNEYNFCPECGARMDGDEDDL